jgi:hypothetical protein
MKLPQNSLASALKWMELPQNPRHPRESGDPFSSLKKQWIPAFAE